MPIDKLIPRYLNKDDDYLLVKSVEMVDALNIQTADDEGGNAGVVKNALGNVVVSYAATGDALPSGTNTVIGTASSKQTGQIFYFVYNSNNQHSIYEYTSRRNTVKLVYRDPVLNFTATGFVKADCLVKENGDTLLYFTDGSTDPKKINATKALANTTGVSGYPYRAAGATGYTDAEKLLSITTIKAPPLEAPTVDVTTVTGIISNNITKKNFQFACQYIYEDGEVSAISPYSELALDINDFLDGFGDADSDSSRNAINITYKHSKGDVSKIRILYRSGNFPNFSIFKEVDNNRSLSSGVVTFTNSTLGQIISDNEVNKQYDAIPLSARSQVISGNRLSYGNYLEFYDNTTVSSDILLEYNQDAGKKTNILSTNFVNGPGTIVSANTSGVNNLEFELDLANMPESSLSDPSIILNFSVFINRTIINKLTSPFNVGPLSGIIGGLTLGNMLLDIQKKSTFTAYSSKAALASSVINLIDGDYLFNISPEGTLVSSMTTVSGLSISLVNVYFAGSLAANVSAVSVSGSVIKFKITPKSNGLNINSVKITQYNPLLQQSFDVTSFFAPVSWNGISINNLYNITYNGLKIVNLNRSFFINDSTSTTFKSGQNHKFGIVYYDSYNRSSAVNELGEIYNPTEGERQEEYGAAALGAAKVIIRLKSSPPSWAKKWRLVYSPYQTYSFCYTYSAAEAFVSKTSTATGSTQNRSIYISARHLEGKDTSYKESRNSIFNYTYAQGDKLRIISYVPSTANGGALYPKQFVYDIIGYEYFDATNTPVSLATGATNYNERATGPFFILKDENYTGFNADSILNNYSNWASDVVFEVFRPIQSVANSVYRETKTQGDVLQDSGVFYHQSQFRDRTYSFTNQKLTVTSGTAYTSGSIKFYPGDIVNMTAILPAIGSYQLTIKDTYRIYDGRTVVVFSGPLPDAGYDIVSIANIDDSILDSSVGDCYYRLRQIKLNPISGTITASGSYTTNPANVSGIRYVDYYVEDTSISDFYKSDNLSLGRPNVVSSNAKQIERKSSITYSEPYSLDTSVLKLSSFNGGQGNFVDLPNAYGAINYMINNGDTITVLQEVKSSVIPINRNLVEYADGSTNVTISTNYLGNQSVYAGDYGTQNPESVTFYKGRVYFADVRSGKIVRIGGDGIEPISENKIDAYTQDKCFIIASASGVYKVIGGIDPMHNEYLVTYTNVSGGTNVKDTIAYDTEDKVWNTRYSFIPEAYENMDNYMYTFKDGRMYRHTDAATRNRFYESNYASNLTLISAFNNSMVKVAEALSIEGNSQWSAQVKSTISQSSGFEQRSEFIQLSDYSLKEGMYYASIPMNINTGLSPTSNRTVIGYVAATGTWASGATITLGNPIVAPFQASGNASIFCLNASGSIVSTLASGTSVYGYQKIEQFDRNTIRLSNLVGAPPSIATGTILVVDSNASVDGDPIRGPYFLIELSNSGIVPIEAYAFNVYFSRSKLHNELVTQ